MKFRLIYLSLVLIPILIRYESFGQQVYRATSTSISFFAGTPIEDIDAKNEKAVSFINLSTGEVIVSITNTAFEFKRPLMQDHFNENYMESAKFPKSEFKGKIDNAGTIAWGSGQQYDVTVTGVLNIHGVEKKRTLPAHVTCDKDRVLADIQFKVPLAEHNIDRPKILWEKLADTVNIRANFRYEPYKK